MEMQLRFDLRHEHLRGLVPNKNRMRRARDSPGFIRSSSKLARRFFNPRHLFLLKHRDGFTGAGANESLRGVLTSFTVIAADRFGNRRREGGDQIQADFAGPTYLNGRVQDNRDGTYTISYSTKIPGRSVSKHSHSSTQSQADSRCTFR